MNRKQRNLQFIRTKNNLRRGIVGFYLYSKINRNIIVDYEFLNDLKETTKRSLAKNYKLKIDEYKKSTINLDVGYIGEDFTKNLNTWTCKINLIGK